MNKKLTQWFSAPSAILALLHAALVVIASIAISRMGSWSLWLIMVVALVVVGLSWLDEQSDRDWLDEEILEHKLKPGLHALLSALWGISFFTALSANWPLIFFILATLVLAYLILTPESDVRLLAAGIVPAGLAAAIVLMTHGYYLTGTGLLLLLGLVLGYRHHLLANEGWEEDPAPTLDENPAAEPLMTPPAGPDPETERTITELKNQVRMLEADLSSAEMTKMEFLATMSHEIRTPLNGIIPLLDILLDSELSDFQKDYLQTAFISAKQMQKLIDDLLDYSKVEAGKLRIEQVGLKLPQVLESVVKALEPSAQKKNLRIELEVSPYISPLLRGDPLRLRQVVTNLLSNAIKFSDRGIITVRADKTRDDGEHEHVRISVKDQGIGIDKEQQTLLFQAFNQADGSSTRKFGGTGIGLAISKKIVELMGGGIGVDSEKGKGSTFYVDIPLLKPVHHSAITQKAADDTDHSSSGPGYQALILNTSFSTSQWLMSQLKSLSIGAKAVNHLSQITDHLKKTRQHSHKAGRVLVFVDFDTAAKQARQLIANTMEPDNADDFILCVITSQPRIAGVPKSPRIQLLAPKTPLTELLQRLKEDATSSATDKTPQAAHQRDSGFGGLDLDEAEQRPDSTCEQPAAIVSKQPGTNNTPATVTPTGAIDERVLLVEDNEVNLKVAQKLIQYIGYTFDVAKNGLEALEKVKKTRYRMVLMDCQMPVMDGYLCTQRIREYEETEGLPRTPIIAMTANAMMGDREKCLDAGMDDYMSKPLNRYVLEKTLKKWDPLQNKPENPAATAAQHPHASINDKWLSTKTLSEIREFMGDDVQRLLSLFKQDAPGTLRHMRKALQTRNFQELRTLAHSLKSSSANIGARGLSYFCKRMEAEALSEDMQRLNALMENIKKSYLLTVREIDKYDQTGTKA